MTRRKEKFTLVVSYTVQARRPPSPLLRALDTASSGVALSDKLSLKSVEQNLVLTKYVVQHIPYS
jgi:hypothetical protein